MSSRWERARSLASSAASASGSLQGQQTSRGCTNQFNAKVWWGNACKGSGGHDTTRHDTLDRTGQTGTAYHSHIIRSRSSSRLRRDADVFLKWMTSMCVLKTDLPG